MSRHTALLLSLTVAACGGGQETGRAPPADTRTNTSATVAADQLPAEGSIGRVPLGEFAGGRVSALNDIVNPLAGNAAAAQTGKTFFIQMNCAGCHGYDLTGGMGPDLTDRYWRYGGAPVDIYNSIFQGRPQGMPAWGNALQPQAIWQLVTYIESFGGSFPSAVGRASLEGDRKSDRVAPEARRDSTR